MNLYSPAARDGDDRGQVYSVVELSQQIKGLLERSFHNVQVVGEITDVARPASGHIYFTLRGLGKLPAFEGVVYRGYPHRELALANYSEGRPIQWGAWSSTTTDRNAAANFAGPDAIIFKIINVQFCRYNCRPL